MRPETFVPRFLPKSNHFVMSAELSQMPITGGFGFYWAYDGRKVEMLEIHRNDDGVHSLRRITGEIGVDGRALPCVSHKNTNKEDIVLSRNGTICMSVEIKNNTLAGVKVDDFWYINILDNNCSGVNDKLFCGVFSAVDDLTVENFSIKDK